MQPTRSWSTYADAIISEYSLFVIDSPEKHLWCAVLKKAIEDYLVENRPISKNKNTPKLRREATVWIQETSICTKGSLRWVLDYISSDTDRAIYEINKFLAAPESSKIIKRFRANHRGRTLPAYKPKG